MESNMLRRKAQAHLLWYIFYLGMGVVILALISYLGVHIFSIHSDAYGAQNNILFERAIQSLYAKDPLVNRPVGRLKTFSNATIGRLFVSGKKISAKITIDNATTYFNEPQYDLMQERAPVAFDERVKVKQADGKTVRLSVVMER